MRWRAGLEATSPLGQMTQFRFLRMTIFVDVRSQLTSIYEPLSNYDSRIRDILERMKNNTRKPFPDERSSC